MKYLLLLAALCIGVWLWRQRVTSQGTSTRSKPTAKPSAPAAPTEMIACQVCAVHLPRQEALPGASGLYCSDAHRRQAEGRG